MSTEKQVLPKGLRELRTSKGKRQTDLGDLDSTLVSKYENGHWLPGPAMVAHLARELSATPEEVYAACEESRRRHLEDLKKSNASSAPSPAAEQTTEGEG